MKAGILGSRGIPNNYGGFEQLAQWLSAGLAKKGHEVFVYSPHHHPFKENNWNGVNIIHCHDPGNKFGSAGQFIYDRNCIRDARKRDFDVLLHLGYTSDSIWHRRWPKNSINIVNMDGLEWKRSKYGKLTRYFLKWAEAKAAQSADILIADSPGIQEHLLNKHKKQSTYIPYGAVIFLRGNEDLLKRFSLIPECYFLAIARMEPENNIEMIIRGYVDSGQEDPLVIIGAPVSKHGKILLRNYRNYNVIFAGAVYEQAELNNLRYFSSVYFHGHSAGGTNPSLLEAMACGCNIAAHKNIFNQFVLGNDASYFSSSREIAGILNKPGDPATLEQWKQSNLEKIKTKYNWEKIVQDYETVMLNALQSKKSSKQPG